MELCREYGISKVTLYNWRKKYSGMDASHLKEMKALQEENRRLKQIYAELMLDHQLVKKTSFKAARLVATQLDFIDKVFFVVDRKDLDFQTMKEYQRFSPDSVNGSDSTAGLKRNIEKDDNRIIVTTIQKLNNLMKSEGDLAIYQKQVVFIFDVAHRSQFGEAQKNLKKKFKKFYQIGKSS
jgi:type I site-specific restriction endonuclease